MKLVVKRNRELAPINSQNTQNENRAETIELIVPEEYESFNKKIVFITPNETVWDVITNNKYKITNAITQYDKVDYYIWLTKEIDGESIDFRTKTKTLNFYHNTDASDEITDEEIHGVNTVVNLLEEEIEKVENLNIEATKIGSTTTVTITKKDGTTESVEINDGVDGQDGQDGQDGYTPQKGIDYFTQEDIEEIETDVKNDIEENVLVNYSLIAETGAKIELSINQTNYKLTAILKDKNNNIIHTSNVIDLPLETMVVNATYDNVNKAIILTLQNGTTVSISVADLVSGLVSESQLQTILSNFYNKTEINNLLNNKVDKVQGKELSSNDFTDILKEKLEGLENYDDTEIKADISDIQDEQVEQNTDIENLQEENERLKATLPTTTGEGQDITLDKTAEMEFVKPPLPRGNSEQESTTGKNLLKPDGLPTTIRGVSWSYREDGAVVGTRVSSNENVSDFTLMSSSTFQPGSYIYSCFDNESTPGASKYQSNISINGASYWGTGNYSFVLNEVSTIRVVLRVYPNFTGAAIFKPMIRLSSIQESNYEPYTGGIPSPNPDYPQEIRNVTGDVEVVVSNADSTKSQTFTFPLGNEKLMLGDYLADDGIHHVRRQGVLDGTETWFSSSYSDDTYLCAFSGKFDGYIKYDSRSLLCNTFVKEFYTDVNTKECIENSGYTVNLKILKSRLNEGTLNGLKTWLAERYSNNMPVIVEYPLAREVIVPYTSAQQEVYNQIKQALSYEEQTNISGSSDESNPIFDVEAYQSTKLILENLDSRLTLVEG